MKKIDIKEFLKVMNEARMCLEYAIYSESGLDGKQGSDCIKRINRFIEKIPTES